MRGSTYRPGFLVNSQELSTLVHLFAVDGLNEKNVPVQVLEALPPRADVLSEGTLIGTHNHAGTPMEICIPRSIRRLNTHIIALPQMGKTVLMIQMFLQDIMAGHGAMFIDPHGDAINMILGLIPRHLYPKVVHFKPGDAEWIPLWNPLRLRQDQDIYQMANDFISAFKRVVTGWGDRMETVLRNALVGLGYIQRTTLLDLYNLTRQKSPESELLRTRIVQAATDPLVRAFWAHDFLKNYKHIDLAASQNKLSKLGIQGSISLMLWQPENRISLQGVMDNAGIMLVDLSALRGDTNKIIGELVLSPLFILAKDRLMGARQQFRVFVDECYHYMEAETIDEIFSEAAKFGLDITVAHQRLKQFPVARADALSGAGTTIIGRIDRSDAQFFLKDLQDKVDIKDLINLPPHRFVAKVGVELPVKIETRPLPEPNEGNSAHEIIERCRRLYYKRAEEVERQLARRDAPPRVLASLTTTGEGGQEFSEEDLRYDEF